MRFNVKPFGLKEVVTAASLYNMILEAKFNEVVFVDGCKHGVTNDSLSKVCGFVSNDYGIDVRTFEKDSYFCFVVLR